MTRKKASSREVTIGIYSRQILSLLYRYGGLTRHQIRRLTGLSLEAIGRQITHLRKAGLVSVARDADAWQDGHQNGRSGVKPHSVYYLALPAGGRAGGRTVGVEYARAALRDYRRTDMPNTTAHRVLANEYLLALWEAALAAGVEMPAEEIWSESWPEFPLFGAGRAKTSRKDTSYFYMAIPPDGTWLIDWNGEVGEQRYHLELERALRISDVADKVRDYAGRWRRKLSPNAGEEKWHDAQARLEPVVIITEQDSHANRLQKALRERLVEVENWTEAEAAISQASGAEADPRQLVLLADWEEVRTNPLGRVYRPLRPYPAELSAEGGWRVSLADAAAVAAKIVVPGKKAVKARLEAEAKAAEENKEVASQ